MKFLLASDNNLVLHSTNDALDVLSSGLSGCIFTPEDLHPNFFDLSNRIAGDVFQKFVSYDFRVAFVVPTNHAYGDRVTELMREHRNHSCVRFFSSIEDANAWLS